MPKIIGQSSRVVDFGGLTIDEYAGNVGTKEDTISIALVKASEATSEPWLTLHYDEWICILKGNMEFQSEGNEPLVAKAGDTVFVAKGERFRPFASAGTEYVPVCLPAFRPDRCIREEDANSTISTKLKELHSDKAANKKNIDRKEYDDMKTLYHMCQKSLWDDAVKEERAYFPPTFEADGFFTHATAVPTRLITTANHFYTETEGDWICLELNRAALFKLGIDTVFEEAKPVGATATDNSWETWVCPHIYGGLPTHIEGIVTKTYDMKRETDGTFLSIVGLTDK